MTIALDIRAALYWAPSLNDALAQAGNAWLGRDCEYNRPCLQPAIPGLAEITEAPRRYGFHATLRPPMRLATGWAEFQAAVGVVAQTAAPFDLPPLEVAEIDGFLALRETARCPALHILAESCVRETDHCRVPPSQAECARRRQHHLTQRQENLLQHWGYPYVMEEWRFHMTLTRRLSPAEMQRFHPAAMVFFKTALQAPLRVVDIAVFTQRGQAPFLMAERHRLGKTLLF